MTNVSLTVVSDLKNLSEIRNFVGNAAKDAGLSDEGVAEIRLAVDEACANIIQHGYKNNDGEIVIGVTQDNDKVVVTVSDDAPSYNPLKETPEPDLDAPLDERPLGGMGFLIIRENTDAVEYRARESGGNALSMAKHFLKQEPTTLGRR